MSNYPNLNQYAGLLSREVNSYLRGESGNKERYGAAVKGILTELNTLEPFNSRVVLAHDLYTGISFRGMAVWYNKRIGNCIQFPNFLSSSKRREVSFSAPTVYHITTSISSAGRDITDVVAKPGEAEVLFAPNTIFKIVRVADEPYIELQEVHEAESPIIITREEILADEEVNAIYERENDVQRNRNARSSLSDMGEI